MIGFKNFFKLKNAGLTALSDEMLLELISDRDVDAFSVLVHRHTDRFYKIAFRTLSNKQDAEDIVQDGFIKLWNRPLWKDNKGAKFTTWFYRIIINMCVDHLRKNRTDPTENFDDFISDDILIDEKIIKTEKERQIEKAIQSLPQKQKTALNLSYYQGLKNKDAADVMEIGEKAFESLLYRAKEGLKIKLKDYHDG